jgi:hypothetical protein
MVRRSKILGPGYPMWPFSRTGVKRTLSLLDTNGNIPRGYGKWRYGYIQQYTSWSMVDKSVPGSITRFSKALGVLHWLLGETPTKVVPWVYRPVSSVRYLRVTYDLMPQSIRFSTGKPEVSLIPTARRPILRHVMGTKAASVVGVDDTAYHAAPTRPTFLLKVKS